jgi:hypothetical protein
MQRSSFSKDGHEVTPAPYRPKRTSTTTDLQKNAPSPLDNEEILDWDCALETPPPPNHSGKIEVVLRKVTFHPSSVESD